MNFEKAKRVEDIIKVDRPLGLSHFRYQLREIVWGGRIRLIFRAFRITFAMHYCRGAG